MPINYLRWSLIILNIFLENIETASKKIKQLKKADKYLKQRIDYFEMYRNFKF